MLTYRVHLIAMRKIHVLKTWPEFFEPLLSGKKTFEVRKNDRDFQVGDALSLLEWEPESRMFSGRKIYCDVSYILAGPAFGIEGGFVVLALCKKEAA